jgi:TolB protein
MRAGSPTCRTARASRICGCSGAALNLPPNLQALEKWRVVFGPRSNDVTFVMHKDNNTDIFMSEMGGTSLRRLTTHRAIEVSPSWSPDGKRMVFMSDRSGTPQLYILDVESGQERRITYKGEYNASPAWSPTGEWIVYSARTGLENMDIYVIDPESLYSYPVVLHERVDQDPAWSPDGRKIVFSSDRRGKRDIYTVDLDGNNLLRLTSDFGSCTGPSWASWIE